MYVDVSTNRGTPKWLVYIMENPIKMDDLGVPLFLETPMYNLSSSGFHWSLNVLTCSFWGAGLPPVEHGCCFPPLWKHPDLRLTRVFRMARTVITYIDVVI